MATPIGSTRARLRLSTPPPSRQHASERRRRGWRKRKPGRDSRSQKAGASSWTRYADRGLHRSDPYRRENDGDSLCLSPPLTELEIEFAFGDTDREMGF